MKMLTILMLVFFAKLKYVISQNKTELELLINKPLEERIRFYGYPAEIYQVKTEDNYLVDLYRVPNGYNNKNARSKNKSSVLLMHGLGGHPKNFFILGNRSIGLGLADQDFDVWVLCNRGVDCYYKQKHLNWDWNADKDYWKFTLEDIAIYDVAASIDFILEKTGQKKLFLIGHSAGGTYEFMLLSERPEYNKKVKIAVSYAGAVYLTYANFPLLKLIGLYNNITKEITLNIFQRYELFPSTISNTLTKVVDRVLYVPIISDLIYFIFMYLETMRPMKGYNRAYWPILFKDISYRVSTMTVFHYFDIAKSGYFSKYDYGIRKNLKKYGQIAPPEYNLTKISCPVAAFYAQNDDQATLKDTRRTISQLPNVIMDYLVPSVSFAHTNFIFSEDAPSLVYKPTFKLLKNFDSISYQ